MRRAPQLRSHLRHACAIGFGGVQVALGNVLRRAGGADLGHHARAGTQAVDAAVVHCRLTDPDHALLHGQGNEVLNGGQLVAAEVGRTGEATGHFVLPSADVPAFGRCIGEFLELPRHHAHVGGRAHDDGVSLVQRGPLGVGDVAVGVNGNQLRISAVCNKLGYALGVAVAGMENNHGFGHEETPRVQKMGTPTRVGRGKRKPGLAGAGGKQAFQAHRSNTSTSASRPSTKANWLSPASSAASPVPKAWPLALIEPRNTCT